MASGNRNIFFILNGILLICGIAVGLFGIFARSNANDLIDQLHADALSNNTISDFPYTRYFWYGVIMCLIAVVGAYAAFTENRSILMIHAIVSMIIMAIFFLWMLYTFWFAASIPEEKTLGENFSTVYANQTGDYKKFVEDIHVNAECCGNNNATDYTDIPKFCCKSSDLGKDDKCTLEKAYKDCCSKSYAAKMIKGLESIRSKYFWIGFTELLGLICASGLIYVTRCTRDQGFAM